MFPPPPAVPLRGGEQFSQFKKSKSTFYLARECCLNRCVAVSCGTATASSRFCVRGFCATLGIAVSTCMAWFSWADILSWPGRSIIQSHFMLKYSNAYVWARVLVLCVYISSFQTSRLGNGGWGRARECCVCSYFCSVMLFSFLATDSKQARIS